MRISLRKRLAASGRTSLYLDIYANGKREYQYLNLFLEPIKTPIDRKQNRETLQLAEAIKAQKLVDAQNGMYGFKKVGTNGDKDFLAYFKKLADDRYNSIGNYGNWLSAYTHFKNFTNDKCQFKDIDQDFIERFKYYLLNNGISRGGVKIAQNSAHSYFNKFRAVLNSAFETKLIEDNPAKRVRGIKQDETKREYLTFEEVKQLAEMDCRYPSLKNAFLFSVLTGLRWSDIDKLLWSEIEYSEKTGWSIVFKQKKTKEQEYLPMTEQARELLGQKGNSEYKVFNGLKYSAYMNVELSRWIMKAGITKNITFHCARHTHATLLLSNGVDIYTVSKLLGHKQVKTTQLYGKIIDEKKIEAVNRLPRF